MWETIFRVAPTKNIASGKRLHSELENHHAIDGKTHYKSMASFNSKLLNYQRVSGMYWASWCFMIHDSPFRIMFLIIFFWVVTSMLTRHFIALGQKKWAPFQAVLWATAVATTLSWANGSPHVFLNASVFRWSLSAPLQHSTKHQKFEKVTKFTGGIPPFFLGHVSYHQWNLLYFCTTF